MIMKFGRNKFFLGAALFVMCITFAWHAGQWSCLSSIEQPCSAPNCATQNAKLVVLVNQSTTPIENTRKPTPTPIPAIHTPTPIPVPPPPPPPPEPPKAIAEEIPKPAPLAEAPAPPVTSALQPITFQSKVEIARRFRQTVFSITYPPFKIPLPNFLNGEDRRFYLENGDVGPRVTPDGKHVHYEGERFERADVVLMRNITFANMPDCGFGNEPREWRQNFAQHQIASSIKVPRMLPLILPDGWAFQHFLDCSLPKWIHAAAMIPELLEIPVLVFGNNQPRVNELHTRLGIKMLNWAHGAVYSVEDLWMVCRVSAYHPQVWRKGRDALLGPRLAAQAAVPWPAPDNGTGNIVYVPRANARNGRPVAGDDQIQNRLREKYGSRYHSFDANNYPTLEKLFEFMIQARVVVGAHGGALYNAMFCREQTAVIEFRAGEHHVGSPIILWWNAAALKQDFTFIKAGVSGGATLINADQLIRAIDEALTRPPEGSSFYFD